MIGTLMHRKQTSASLPHLPQDIITEILLFLPVKSLSIFKCVCKTWNSIISHLDFIKTHLQIPKKNCKIILGFTKQFRSITFYTCSLDPFVKYESVEDVKPIKLELDVKLYGELQLVGSSNGLCCMRIVYDDSLVIFNPSTRKSKLIRPNNRFPVLSGFCYDNSNDDYKVVQVQISEPHRKNIRIEVYSLRANSWTTKPFPMRVSALSQGIAFVCGNFHWAAEVNNSWIVISYDHKNDMFGDLMLPHNIDVGKRYNTRWTLGVLKGCLYSIHLSGHNMDMWMMSEYGVQKSWNKIGAYCSEENFFVWNFRSIGAELDGVEDNFTPFNHVKSLWLWDAKRGMSTLKFKLPANYEHINVVSYLESLVSPSFGEDKAIEDKSRISKMNV